MNEERVPVSDSYATGSKAHTVTDWSNALDEDEKWVILTYFGMLTASVSCLIFNVASGKIPIKVNICSSKVSLDLAIGDKALPPV